MPVPDSLLQTVGAQALPAVDTDVTDTLAPLDKARDGLLALFTAALNSELSGAWNKVVALVPSLAGSVPVVDAVPFAPTPELMLQRKAGFPMLALARDGEVDIDEFTLWEEQFVQSWSLTYILSPIDIGNVRKLGDILVRVATCCQQTVRNMRHLAYQGGAYMFPTWGLSKLLVTKCQAGQARFVTGDNAPTYAAMSMALRSTELTGFVDGAFAEFDGIGFNFGTGTVEGIIDPLVQADTEVPLVLG